MAVELLTVSEYARRRGCDEKAVRKAIAEGRITAIVVDGKRRIDPEVADIQWAKNTRARVDSGAAKGAASPGGNSSPSGPASALDAPTFDQTQANYHATRAKREEVELRRAEIALEEEEKRLIERDAALTSVFTAFRSLRDGAMPLGRRLSSKLATMTDPLEIQLLVDEAVRDVFRTFHDRTLAALTLRLGGEAGSVATEPAQASVETVSDAPA